MKMRFKTDPVSEVSSSSPSESQHCTLQCYSCSNITDPAHYRTTKTIMNRCVRAGITLNSLVQGLETEQGMKIKTENEQCFSQN